MVRQGQGRDVLRTAYDKVNDAVGIKQSERKPGVIIGGLGGVSLFPPPACHSDPRKEDEVEGGNSGECRDEEANADAIVTLVVAVVAAKQVASCRKGVIAVVYGTEVVVVLILVKVQLSVLSGGGFGAVLVHGLSLFSAPSVQFCTESVTHPRRYKLNNSFHCDKFVLSVRA